MSCESCADIERVDGEQPPCLGGTCIIPPPDAAGERVLKMRGMILALKDLTGAGPVLRAFGAAMRDLELLAAIEGELKQKAQENRREHA